MQNGSRRTYVIGRLKQPVLMRFAWSRAALVGSASLSPSGPVTAENVQNRLSAPLPQAPDPSHVGLQPRFLPFPADPQAQLVGAAAGDPSTAQFRPSDAIELAHRMVSAVRVRTPGYAAENARLFLTRAALEVQMVPAELEHREVPAGLKARMREP